MTVDELITFCTLKGNIEYHEELRPGFWRIRLLFGGKAVTFLYHKNPVDEKLIFLNGRVSSSEGDLGTTSEQIWGFNHLMKKLS